MPKKAMHLLSDQSEMEKRVTCMRDRAGCLIFDRQPSASFQKNILRKKTKLLSSMKDEYFHVSSDEVLPFSPQKGPLPLKKLHPTALFHGSTSPRSFLKGHGSPLMHMSSSFEFEQAKQPLTGHSLDSPFYFNNSPIVYPQKQQKALAYNEIPAFDFDELNVPFGEVSNEATDRKGRQAYSSDIKGTREVAYVRPFNQSKISDECQNSSAPRFNFKDFQKHIEESNNLLSPWSDSEAKKAIGKLKESIRLLAKFKDKEVKNVNSKQTGQHPLNSKKASQFAQKDDSRHTVKETLQEILHADYKVPIQTGEKAKGLPRVQGRREENGYIVGGKSLGSDLQKGKETSRILMENEKLVKPIVSPENSTQTRSCTGETSPRRENDLKGNCDSYSQGYSNRMISENVNNGDKYKRTSNVIARLMGLDAMPESKGSIPSKHKKGPISDVTSLQQGGLFNKSKRETAKNQGINKFSQHKKQQDVQTLHSQVKNEWPVGETIEQDKSNIQSRVNRKTQTKAFSKQQSMKVTSHLAMLNGQRHTKYPIYVSAPAPRYSTDNTIRASQEMNDIGNATLTKACEEHKLFQEHFENKKHPYQIPVSNTNHGLDGETEARIRQLRLQNVLEKHKTLKEILEKMQLKGLSYSPLSKKMQEIQHQNPIGEVPRMKLTDENVESQTDDFGSLDLAVDKEVIPTNFREAAIVLVKPIIRLEESKFTASSHGPLEMGHSQISSMVMPHKSDTVQPRIVESKKAGDKKLIGNSETDSRIFKSHNSVPILVTADGSQTTEPKNSYRQQFESCQFWDYEEYMKKGSHFKPPEKLLPAPPIFKLLVSRSKQQFSGKDSITGGTDCAQLRDFRNAENMTPEALKNAQPLEKPHSEFSARQGDADCEHLFLQETDMQHKTLTPCDLNLPVICHAVKSVKSYNEEHDLNLQLTPTARKTEIEIDSSRLHVIPNDATNLHFIKKVDKCFTTTGLDSQIAAFPSRKELACQSTQHLGRVISSEEIAANASAAVLGKRASDWETSRDLRSEKEEILNKLEELGIAGLRGLARCRNEQKIDDNARKTLTEAKLNGILELPKTELHRIQYIKTQETVRDYPVEADICRGELHVNASIGKVLDTSARDGLHLCTYKSQELQAMENENLKNSKAMQADLEEKSNMEREGTLERHKCGIQGSDDKLMNNASKGYPAKQLPAEHAVKCQPAEVFSADAERHSPISVLDIHFQEDDHVHATTSSYVTKSQESAPLGPLASSSRRRSLDFSFQKHVDKILQGDEALQDLTGIVYATFQTDVPHYTNATDKKDQFQENLSVTDSGKFQWQGDGMASIKDLLELSGFTEMSQLLTKAQAPVTDENHQKGLMNKGEIHGHWKKNGGSDIDKNGKKSLQIAERRLHFECVNEILAKKLLPFVDPHPWLSLSQPILRKRPPGKQLVQQAWKELDELPCVPVEDACDMLHILLEHDLAQIPSQWSELKTDTVEAGLYLASMIFEDAVAEMICDLVLLTEARKV